MKITTFTVCLACLLMTLALFGCGGGGSADTLAAGGCSQANIAACGGSGGVLTPVTPVTPVVVPPTPAELARSVSLVFSNTELASAGLPGTEVTITALVKDGANNALADAKIAFSADGGLLSGAAAVTDKNGKATVLLGTGGAPANRAIHVRATVGEYGGEGVVQVVGTHLAIAGPGSIALGRATELVVTLQDSNNRAIAAAPLAFRTQNGNPLAVKDGAAALTDALGQVTLLAQGGKAGPETVSVSALGAALSVPLAVEDAGLDIAPAVTRDAAGAELLSQVETGACQAVDVRRRADTSALVNLSTSRGTLYRDAECSTPLNAALTLDQGGAARAYVRSVNACVAVLGARAGNDATASTRIEFVAPLTAAAILTLQANPAVIGSNSGAGQAAQSRLSAVVRDGSAANNLVKGATVVYSIVSDASGGYLLAPSSARTGGDGLAQAVYVAGAGGSGKDGVVIAARIEGLTGARASAEVTLSVASKALSIQFGSGNSAIEYSPSLLQQQFSVLVSDAAGNPVPNVAITASVWAAQYRKGHFVWVPDNEARPEVGFWLPATPVYACGNEDRLRNGLYDPAFDLNNNGSFEPGLPLTVSAGASTDALGLASVTLNYPRDRGYWVQAEVSVRGSVAGSESGATTRLWLPTLSSDFSNRRVSPPGQVSPYGEGLCDSGL